MKKIRTRVAFAGLTVAGAVILSIMFAGSGAARDAAVAPGVLCQADGKISGRGSTFQARALNSLFTSFTNDVCGNVPDNPPNPGTPAAGAGNLMGEYNLYEPANGGAGLTGSGNGMKTMACRTDAFGGTDTPYNTNQLQSFDGPPAVSNGANTTTPSGNADNQYILGGTSPNFNTCQATPTTAFGLEFFPPYQPQDGGPSPTASLYPNSTSGAADQQANMMSFPIGGSAVAILVNLTGICTVATPTSLSFTGIQLSELFGGDIATWNDPRLTTNNPILSTDNCTGNVTRVVRLDNSGTTQIFKTYLNHIDPNRTAGTGETCDTGTGADGNSTWTELIAQSPNTNWPGYTAGGTAQTGCSPVVQGDVSGNNGVLDECEGNTGGGNTVTGVPGAICYADLPDQRGFATNGGHGGVPGCSPCTGIVASVQNATLSAFVSPAHVTTANCNYGTMTLPSGGGGAVGLTTGPAFTPPSPPPAGWDTWANDNPTGFHGDVTDTGTVYPICGLTYDMVFSGLSNATPNSSAINNLTSDQRRTLYAFFAYALSSAGQAVLTNTFYQALPATIAATIRSQYESNF